MPAVIEIEVCVTGLLQQRSGVASYITMYACVASYICMYACVACPVGMKLARQVCEVVLCIAPSYSVMT